MSREKLVTKLAIRSKEEMERIVRVTVSKQIEREKLVAIRDEKLQALTEKHNGPIDLLGAEIESNMVILEQWSDANPDVFGKARSIRVDGHQLGYRTGQPTAKTLKGWTWKKVTDKLLGMRKALRTQFLRTKIEPDKEAMIKERNRIRLLSRFGVEIVQGESFFLDPNREGQPSVKLAGDKKEVAA